MRSQSTSSSESLPKSSSGSDLSGSLSSQGSSPRGSGLVSQPSQRPGKRQKVRSPRKDPDKSDDTPMLPMPAKPAKPEKPNMSSSTYVSPLSPRGGNGTISTVVSPRPPASSTSLTSSDSGLAELSAQLGLTDIIPASAMPTAKNQVSANHNEMHDVTNEDSVRPRHLTPIKPPPVKPPATLLPAPSLSSNQPPPVPTKPKPPVPSGAKPKPPLPRSPASTRRPKESSSRDSSPLAGVDDDAIPEKPAAPCNPLAERSQLHRPESPRKKWLQTQGSSGSLDKKGIFKSGSATLRNLKSRSSQRKGHSSIAMGQGSFTMRPSSSHDDGMWLVKVTSIFLRAGYHRT